MRVVRLAPVTPPTSHPSRPSTRQNRLSTTSTSEPGAASSKTPKGVTHPDLEAAREEALATARTITAEGDQKGEERRSWCFEIMDRANQQVLTVAFLEALDSTAPR
jgi:hypothetical protein